LKERILEDHVKWRWFISRFILYFTDLIMYYWHIVNMMSRYLNFLNTVALYIRFVYWRAIKFRIFYDFKEILDYQIMWIQAFLHGMSWKMLHVKDMTCYRSKKKKKSFLKIFSSFLKIRFFLIKWKKKQFFVQNFYTT